jgi:uncharacterized protein YcbK (DUF882 family)
VAARIARRQPLIFSSPRAGYCFGLAVLVLLLSCDGLQNAIAVGDTRTISMHHTHTGEDITVTFKQNGRYDEEALKKLNWFLRDWRTDEPTKMDPKLFDILSELYREVGGEKPIHIISAYRSPKTNAMLRKRSRGVARTSQHMAGRAIDFFIPDVPLENQRIIGLKLQQGGVGYYPGSANHFIHLDTGSVRHWPRMPRDQLARVFPDGRTVHIPADGQPLSGFARALADVERRGGSASAPSLAAARQAGTVSESGETAKPGRSLLARIFGVGAEEDEDAGVSAPARSSSTVAKNDPVPLPRTRPGGYQIASASTQPATYQTASLPPHLHRPASAEPADGQASTPSATPNQTILARGYWQGNVDQDVTGSISAPRSEGRDRVSELALAYAAHSAPAPGPSARTELMGSFLDRMSPIAADAQGNPTGVTVAVKNGNSAAMKRPRPSPAAMPVRSGQRFDEPWLRATIVTPSVHDFLTATRLGALDHRTLRPLLEKPPSAVLMTFSADPHRGLVSAKFAGEAIVFISTVTFDPHRTAALR